MVSDLQTVFFVRRGSESGFSAERVLPVVLIDAALQHRYEDTLEMRVVDGPQLDAVPVMVINPREMNLLGNARLGVIVDDRRSLTTSPQGASGESQSVMKTAIRWNPAIR